MAVPDDVPSPDYDLGNDIGNMEGIRSGITRIGDTEHIEYTGEFWTSKQRQGSSIHEISYRACFKPQLPGFFIKRFSSHGDVVLDPFSGRGTTVIEAGLLGRKIISNDINPLNDILTRPRLEIPDIEIIEKALNDIDLDDPPDMDPDLSMFFHPDTLSQILALREYLRERKEDGVENGADRWIRMAATNRLTGHSRGFFSAYTLPPNQAASRKSQLKINKRREQEPPYRDVKELILKKSRSLQRNITSGQRKRLRECSTSALFMRKDASDMTRIPDETVALTVTSPPFLDIVQYRSDNWLRFWFNTIDEGNAGRLITVERSIENWGSKMRSVLSELFRITRIGGHVAFEVGEVRKGRLRLEDIIVPAGLDAGFECIGIIINAQRFTKTSNIWGIDNNEKGTNTNRIAVLGKI
ncbi:MAG: DNA methyltransferase [Thermoplasmatota archaeon]